MSKFVEARFIEQGDTIGIDGDNEDYLVSEKTTELNGMVGLIVTQLPNGKQSRKYIDPSEDVYLVEAKADRQERRDRFKNTVGEDQHAADQQTKEERRMGL